MSLSTRALIILTSFSNLLDYWTAISSPPWSFGEAELGLSCHRGFRVFDHALFLVYLCTSPVFGYLGDRWGRIRLMAGARRCGAWPPASTFWVSSYPTLLVARGAVGAGEASFGTLAPAYLSDFSPCGAGPGPGPVLPGLTGGHALGFLVAFGRGAHLGLAAAFLLAGLPGLAMAALVYCLPKSAL